MIVGYVGNVMGVAAISRDNLSDFEEVNIKAEEKGQVEPEYETEASNKYKVANMANRKDMEQDKFTTNQIIMTKSRGKRHEQGK